MSIFDKDLLTGRDKIETAIARIQTFCAGKRTLVAFSGGKDSQCCYHLAKAAGIEFSAQYSITRFEPPELMVFIREHYPDCVFRRAYKRTLVASIEVHGLPSMFTRWCCEAKHTKTVGYDIAIIGVRAEESARRKRNWRLFGTKPDKTSYLCPVIDWTEADVWEYLNATGAPHCCLYDPPYNFRRIGCVMCPLKSPREMQRDAQIWPKMAAMIKQGAARFVERMRARNWLTTRGTPVGDWRLAKNPLEEFWRRWIESGQTTMSVEAFQAHQRGRTEDDAPCLFAGTGFSESDGADEDGERDGLEQ